MSSKTKRIAHGHVDAAMLGFVQREVKFRVDFRIYGNVVDGRRDEIVFDGEQTGDGLNSACGAQQVAGHTFGRRYVDFVAVVAKNMLDGFQFGHVAEWGRSAVHVDVVDIAGS